MGEREQAGEGEMSNLDDTTPTRDDLKVALLSFLLVLAVPTLITLGIFAVLVIGFGFP
jgi:hypothetical protein